MMKHIVTITRTESRSHDFVVESDDAYSAEAKAYLEAVNFDYANAVLIDSKYTVDDLVKLEAPK
jgi:hypothetical protein